MAYTDEKASKISHIDIPKNKLIEEILKNITIQKNNNISDAINSNLTSFSLNNKDSTIENIFVVDGSLVDYKDKLTNLEGSLIRTGMLFLDLKQYKLLEERDICHPIVKETFLNNSYGTHATFLVFKNLKYNEKNLYDSIRYLIFDSFAKDEDLKNLPLETLKFLIFKKWENKENNSESFECPSCGTKTIIRYNKDKDICSHCKQEVLITDFVGFHKNMNKDSDLVHSKLANDYMLFHETMLLFSFIIKLYDFSLKHGEDKFKKTLFIKDGPLSLNGIYSKIVNYISLFLKEINNKGLSLNLVGQEKTGVFVEHFENDINKDKFFIINNDYIRKHINPSSEYSKKIYGQDTMYGSKVYVNYKNTHRLILSVNCGGIIKENPALNDFVNLHENITAICNLLTYKYANGIYPISLINSRVSISTNPSGNIIEQFINSHIK